MKNPTRKQVRELVKRHGLVSWVCGFPGCAGHHAGPAATVAGFALRSGDDEWEVGLFGPVFDSEADAALHAVGGKP